MNYTTSSARVGDVLHLGALHGDPLPAPVDVLGVGEERGKGKHRDQTRLRETLEKVRRGLPHIRIQIIWTKVFATRPCGSAMIDHNRRELRGFANV